MMWRKWLRWSAFGLVIVAVGIQFIPYGRDHTNPPVLAEPAWNSPATRDLAVRACYDCHSNQTTWPWYSNIAPISWLIQSDVDSGRQTMNFSEWGSGGERTRGLARVVQDGSMPPFYYTWIHPNSRLSAQEQQQLIDGFVATFGSH